MATIALWAATGITWSPRLNIGSRAGVTRASNLLQLNRLLNACGLQVHARPAGVEPAPGRAIRCGCNAHDHRNAKTGGMKTSWTSDSSRRKNRKPRPFPSRVRRAARKTTIRFAGSCAPKKANCRAAPGKKTRSASRSPAPTWFAWMNWLRAANAGSVLNLRGRAWCWLPRTRSRRIPRISIPKILATGRTGFSLSAFDLCSLERCPRGSLIAFLEKIQKQTG